MADGSQPPFVWEKLGRVFGPDRASARTWMASHSQAPATLTLDGALRIYFSCRPAPDESARFVSYSAFVDVDPSDPRKILQVAERPVLELGGPGTFDEFGTYPISVIRHEGRVRAYYAGWTRCVSVPFNTAIGVAESTDGGRTFERLGPGPVIGYSPDEPFVMSGPKIRIYDDLWYLFYIAGKRWKVVDGRPEPVYRIRMATSPDGLTWTKEGRDLIDTALEADEAQASPDVFRAGGRWHMFFCYRYSEGFRGPERGYRIGYAHSEDGLIWTRDDRLAGLDPSRSGWDSEMVAYPHVFRSGDSTYMAYLGNGVGREGFGLARLSSPSPFPPESRACR